MGWGDNMHGWGGYWFGGVFMVVFWILVVVGIFLIIRGFTSRAVPGGQRGNTESPLEILRRRYAKGEIDKTEFEEKKQDISKS